MASSDANSVVLYSYWRSSSAWRVRNALALKGISYEYHAVDLLKGEQTSPEYVALNPMKEIPTLLIDGHYLCQSVAIIEYLEETRPTVPLFSKHPYQRALIRQVVETIAGDMQPIGNQRVLKYVGEEKKAEWAKHWITVGFTGLEQLLKRIAGKYCVGDELTAADCLLVPQVYNGYRWNVDMTAFPTILRVNEALLALPAFKAAHADAQPDTPHA